MAERDGRAARHEEDDLLEGFSRTGRRAVALRGFFAVTVSAALVGWDLAFTWGAYGTVFYNRTTQLLVLSLVVLLGRWALRQQVREHGWVTFLFALPALWVVFRLLAPVIAPGRAFEVVDGVLTGAMVLSLPLVLWVVARLLAPGYFALPQRRMRVASVVIVAVVSAVGLVVGAWNDHFFTCADFRVAGDYPPPGCAASIP
ncbi:hypothetical protein [Streptomyces bohaiensis]|uniref:Uncharacterized protein n=1 Tax=Streptomyces bohaiensis TaxID=1431344 RepID=A0ABX1C9M1_9ACTN|nr:hypothetical protein [Streptomyces bohaiensis]NJQ14305.1 hypothetical protein [Streptomyces bohaiensis]